VSKRERRILPLVSVVVSINTDLHGRPRVRFTQAAGCPCEQTSNGCGWDIVDNFLEQALLLQGKYFSIIEDESNLNMG
jgi:hypothetical protein